MSCGGCSLKGVRADVRARGEALIHGLRLQGIPGWFTSGYRTRAKQAQLYNRFLAGRSKYPVAPPGHSAHERGLAFDIGSTAEGLAVAGRHAADLGLSWSPRDPVHFEVRG